MNERQPSMAGGTAHIRLINTIVSSGGASALRSGAELQVSHATAAALVLCGAAVQLPGLRSPRS